MKLVPHRELEELSRKLYLRKFEHVDPELVLINREPVISLQAPRAFAWGGVGYRAPPPGYLVGVKILIAADMLRSLRKADVPVPQRLNATRAAARIIRGIVRPVTIIGRLVTALRRCPFASADPVEVEGLLRWLIHVPDDSDIPPPPKRKIPIDLMDGLANFAREFPAWVGDDGYPLSYRLYVYGTRNLTRLSARTDLRQASAVRMAKADVKNWREWAGELSAAAGWE